MGKKIITIFYHGKFQVKEKQEIRSMKEFHYRLINHTMENHRCLGKNHGCLYNRAINENFVSIKSNLLAKNQQDKMQQ